jgi:phosphomevalonate decarboxylase
MKSTAKAHPVQGLVCAHGYKNSKLRTLPVESIFISLDVFETTVNFTFLETKSRPITPEIKMNGLPASQSSYKRMTAFFNRVFEILKISGSYTVDIFQNFPLATGIGSSASIYAALTVSIVNAVKKELSLKELSALARLGSYSAASSIVGNISIIRSSDHHEENIAELLCKKESFPYSILVLPVEGDKRSEEIHEDMVKSPFYSEWLKCAKETSRKLETLISKKQFDKIGPIAERYIYNNFAAISTGSRNILSWNGGTLKRIILLRKLRSELESSFFISTNSGPAVFVYTKPEEQKKIEEALANMGIECIPNEIGGAASTISSI